MTELAKVLAAAGETVPNRIPVSSAMSRLQQEYAEPAPDVTSADDPGSEVIRKAIFDPARAARALSASASWRSTPKDLAAMAVSGAPANGFFVAAATLSVDDWQALHAELVKRFAKADAKIK